MCGYSHSVPLPRPFLVKRKRISHCSTSFPNSLPSLIRLVDKFLVANYKVYTSSSLLSVWANQIAVFSHMTTVPLCKLLGALHCVFLIITILAHCKVRPNQIAVFSHMTITLQLVKRPAGMKHHSLLQLDSLLTTSCIILLDRGMLLETWRTSAL